LDDHAEHYLKIFTLLPMARIEEIMAEHVQAPEKRIAQRIVAEEVVTLVHRTEVAQRCIFQTSALYPGPRITSCGVSREPNFRSESILQAFRGDDVMLKRIPVSSILGRPLSRLLKEVGLVKSYSLTLLLQYLTCR
jgi:tyrosyl-tRNA synthetase